MRRKSLVLAFGLESDDSRGQARLDTNAKLAETIESALRETWNLKAAKDERILSKQDKNGDSLSNKSRRLSNLYGLSPLAPHVTKRSSLTITKPLKTFPPVNRRMSEQHASSSNQDVDARRTSCNSSVQRTPNNGPDSCNGGIGYSFPAGPSTKDKNKRSEENESLLDLQQQDDFHAWYCGYFNYIPDSLPIPASKVSRPMSSSHRDNISHRSYIIKLDEVWEFWYNENKD